MKSENKNSNDSAKEFNNNSKNESSDINYEKQKSNRIKDFLLKKSSGSMSLFSRQNEIDPEAKPPRRK